MTSMKEEEERKKRRCTGDRCVMGVCERERERERARKREMNF